MEASFRGQIDPPILRRLRGSPRKNRRRETDEPPPDAIEARRVKTVKCNNCQQYGHNRARCQKAPTAASTRAAQVSNYFIHLKVLVFLLLNFDLFSIVCTTRV